MASGWNKNKEPSTINTMGVFPQKNGLIGLYLVGYIEILLSEANRYIHARLAFSELLL